MRKTLELFINDLSKEGMKVKFDKVRLEDFNSTALEEAFKSDKVIFHASGWEYTLKDR